MTTEALNVLSLFAGIGGLELGLERAGMTVVGQVEIDPFCQRVLAKHWPEVPRHDDVRTCVDWWASRPRPRVDVVCGGFPCQDISSAGRRAGIINGEKSSLWVHLAHTVRALRPRYVVVENVPALLGRGLDVVAADLAAIGYDLRWDCVPASALGAPHRRDRWFGIGTVADAPSHRFDAARREPDRISGDIGVRSESTVANAEGSIGQNRETRRDRSSFAFGTIPRAGGRVGGGANAAGDRLIERSPGVMVSTVADATSVTEREQATQAQPVPVGWDARALFGGGSKPRRSGAWTVEPDVGRVAHGVPDRVDRLASLGNAVVPQVAEHIGRLILESEAVA